jgi:2-methylcitrate dehydratase PrpD
VLHVPRLHVFDHVTLVGFGVAAVQANPAGDLLREILENLVSLTFCLSKYIFKPFEARRPSFEVHFSSRQYSSYEANMVKDDIVILLFM